jgi:RNA polymerase primary sigma factor
MESGELLDPDALDLADMVQLETEEVEEEIPKEIAESFDDAAKLYLRDIQKNKLLSAEEEREIAALIDQGDKAARAVMIVSNLRLVVKMAKRYLYRGLPLLDLIEEGNLGLIKAVDRFKLSKGCRFSTYASWWIRQCIERALTNQSRSIRLPVHVSELIGKMARVTRELVRELNREPTLLEVAGGLGVELSRVSGLLVYLKRTYSLDQPLRGTEDFYLSDTIEDTANVSPLELVENLNRFELVSKWFKTLSPTEQIILTLRFGLDDKEPQTLDTIGRSFKVTRERIRQIESKALETLRQHLAMDPSHAACTIATENSCRTLPDDDEGIADGKNLSSDEMGATLMIPRDIGL